MTVIHVSEFGYCPVQLASPGMLPPNVEGPVPLSLVEPPALPLGPPAQLCATAPCFDTAHPPNAAHNATTTQIFIIPNLPGSAGIEAQPIAESNGKRGCPQKDGGGSRTRMNRFRW